MRATTINVSLSKKSRQALKILGGMIKAARIERGLSQANLAQRINVSRYSIMALEKGDHKVAIGVAFEAAVILGIPLLAEDSQALGKLERTISSFNTILPKSVRKPREAPADDF